MTFWNAHLHALDLERSMAALDTGLRVGDYESPDLAALGVARTVSWVALTVRKLSGADGLSAELEARRWPLVLHPLRAGLRPPGAADGHRPGHFYDLEIARAQSMRLRRLVGILIHSFILDPVLTDCGSTVAGVRVNSELTRAEGLYFIEWQRIRDIVSAVRVDAIDPDFADGVALPMSGT